MKIVYIVPGIMDKIEAQRRDGLLKSWAFTGTQVELSGVSRGPQSIESMYEEYLSVPAVALKVAEYEDKGFDAAIIGCAGDPGVDAMREISRRMLVVGPGQASYLGAASLGHSFGVVTIDEGMIHSHIELAYKAGVSQKLAKVRAVGIPVLDLPNQKEEVVEKLISLGRLMIREDGVDSIVLGCMSMGFLNVAEDVQSVIGIPVINPSKFCLKYAEMLIASGLSHSKAAFSTPPKIRDGRAGGLAELFVIDGNQVK